VIAQGEKSEQREDRTPSSPTLDKNNEGMLLVKKFVRHIVVHLIQYKNYHKNNHHKTTIHDH
jgi:hypothetical protein